jgi:hypothetical protein
MALVQSTLRPSYQSLLASCLSTPQEPQNLPLLKFLFVYVHSISIVCTLLLQTIHTSLNPQHQPPHLLQLFLNLAVLRHQILLHPRVLPSQQIQHSLKILISLHLLPSLFSPFHQLRQPLLQLLVFLCLLRRLGLSFLAPFFWQLFNNVLSPLPSVSISTTHQYHAGPRLTIIYTLFSPLLSITMDISVARNPIQPIHLLCNMPLRLRPIC